ncbi:MAG: hypothetical protein WCA12_02145, partial [Burkholderiales bacterium]
MALVQFGNTSADMRLVDDFYGIPALRDFVSYLETFNAVGNPVVTTTPAQVTISEVDAQGRQVVFTALGNTTTGQYSQLTVDALGIRETVRGNILLATVGSELSITGTATEAIATYLADGRLIAGISGVSLPIDGPYFPADDAVLSGNDSISSGAGDDYLLGYAGSDFISAGDGNDFLQGGPGSDRLVGGNGIDTAVFDSSVSDYGVLQAPDGRIAVAYEPRGGDNIDVLSGIEEAQFAGVTAALETTDTPLEYVASYPDLMNALGTNGQAGFDHYVNSGYAEGRAITFDGLEYIASYGDLIGALGANADAGAAHYIASGRFEGRQATFDGLQYIASYGDLIGALGANADAGAQHYITNGWAEGRSATFDGLEYTASYADLIAAFGTNEPAATQHYVTNGYAEGRAVSFDGLQYIASYGDLIGAFGPNSDAGSSHFITNGFAESRARDTFDEKQYLANYADL